MQSHFTRHQGVTWRGSQLMGFEQCHFYERFGLRCFVRLVKFTRVESALQALQRMSFGNGIN